MIRSLLLAFLALPGLAVAPGRPADAPTAVERAEVTLAATRRWFGAADATGLYRETHPARASDHRYADEWPYSQVHIGVLDLACLPGPEGNRNRSALNTHQAAQMLYWNPRSTTGLPGFASRVTAPHGDGGDLYYDDNLWVGLAAVQHWFCTRDPASLDLAKTIFDLVRSGWDKDAAHPAPGGIFWTQASFTGDRNTVSNMPAAQLGVRLYEITGDRTYLRDALRSYRWANVHMQRSDGLYHDHIGSDGSIDRRIFSYNQGVPIGVNVLLYKVTKEPRYLDEAKRIAAASYRYYVDGGRLDGQPPAFNAIYFKNLLLLEDVTGGTRYRDAMRAYSDRMWHRYRDAPTGLFHAGSKRSDHFRLIDQGAMIQIDAVLAWDRSAIARLY